MQPLSTTLYWFPNATVGWRCPGCQRCYAPSVTMCPTCGQHTLTQPLPLTYFQPQTGTSAPTGIPSLAQDSNHGTL